MSVSSLLMSFLYSFTRDIIISIKSLENQYGHSPLAPLHSTKYPKTLRYASSTHPHRTSMERCYHCWLMIMPAMEWYFLHLFSLLLHPQTRFKYCQTLGIDFHELNRFSSWNWFPWTESIQFAIFENSRTNPTESPQQQNKIWTELNLELVNCELNSTHNRKNWWTNWAICWRILMKLYLRVIGSARTELILPISDRVYPERLSPMQNRELNYIH